MQKFTRYRLTGSLIARDRRFMFFTGGEGALVFQAGYHLRNFIPTYIFRKKTLSIRVFLHVFLLLNISVMSFSIFTNMIDQKHSFLQLCTFLHPWTMCTRNLSPGSCRGKLFLVLKKKNIIRRFLVLFCFCFCFYLFLFYFCFVLFCFLTRMMISNFKINTSAPPLRISYKCQFSGLVSSTQLFDLFTFSKLNF